MLTALTPAPAAPPQILAGYDLALVQEVRDPDLSAVSALMEQINRCGGQGPSSRPPAGISPRRGALTLSGPLSPQRVRARVQLCEQRAPGPGPVQGDVPVRVQVRGGPQGGARGAAGGGLSGSSPSPRKDAVSVVDTYLYPDPEDVFSREPFVVKFSAPGTGERAPPLPFRRPAPPLPPSSDAPTPSRSSTEPGADPAARGAASSRGGDRRALRRVPGRDRQVGHRRKPTARSRGPCRRAPGVWFMRAGPRRLLRRLRHGSAAPAGHAVPGRLQRRLQLCAGAGLGRHPSEEQ